MQDPFSDREHRSDLPSAVISVAPAASVAGRFVRLKDPSAEFAPAVVGRMPFQVGVLQHAVAVVEHAVDLPIVADPNEGSIRFEVEPRELR